MSRTKTQRTVTFREAQAMLPELLAFVHAGNEVVITRGGRAVARVVPAARPVTTRGLFSRIRAFQAKASLPQGESTKDLITACRRI